jgi:uncharacterized RDD family membrane protein YckC
MTLLSRKQSNPPNFIGHYAGFVTRLIAFIIDILIVTISISIMWGVLNLILRFFNLSLIDIATEFYVINDFWRTVIIFLTGFGFTFFVALLYNISFWMLAGKTLGKAIMGIRVIGPRGARVTLGRALRRYLGYWLAALPLFLGFFWVLITEERTGWHDKLAGTRVIYDYEARYSAAMVGRLTEWAAKLETKRRQKNAPTTSDSNAQ